MNRFVSTGLVLAGLLATACGDDGSGQLGRGYGGKGPDDPGGGPGPGPAPTSTTNPNPPEQCVTGASYVGFDGVKLEGTRVQAALGVDRGRVKPYSALVTEYPRVLGNTPASLAGAATTFGQPPARWYDEPVSGAVSLQTSLAVAFDGCLTLTATDAQYGSAPTTATAQASCAAMAKSFWSRTPTTAEIQSCVDVAVTGSAAETNARRRWAYACASVLNAAGFLTY
jgi:hypothetical protein